MITTVPEPQTNEQRVSQKLVAAEDAAVELAEDFLVMVRRREGAQLGAWLDRAEACDIDDV